MENSRNKQFTSLKLCSTLSSTWRDKSLAPPGPWLILCFSRRGSLPISHLGLAWGSDQLSRHLGACGQGTSIPFNNGPKAQEAQLRCAGENSGAVFKWEGASSWLNKASHHLASPGKEGWAQDSQTFWEKPQSHNFSDTTLFDSVLLFVIFANHLSCLTYKLNFIIGIDVEKKR